MTRSLNNTNRPDAVQVADDGSSSERLIFAHGAPVPLSPSRSVLQWAIAHHLMFRRATADERRIKRDPHASNARSVSRYSFLDNAAMSRAMERL